MGDWDVQSSYSSTSRSLMGLSHLQEPKSKGGDEASLAYSVDDHMSRASGFVSAVSEFDEQSKASSQYYHPAMPTPVVERPRPPPPPPPPPQESESQSGFQSLLDAPMSFLFGGNESDEDDDDNLSALGYDDFGETMDAYEDDATIATSAELRHEEMQQSRILTSVQEDDEESTASAGDRSIVSEANPMHSSFHQSYKSFASRSYADRSTGNADQGPSDPDNALGTASMHQSASVSFFEEPEQYYYDPQQTAAEHLHEKISYHTTEQVDKKLAAQQAFDFTNRSVHSRSSLGMTDLDASRSRASADDRSLSLSQVFQEEKQTPLPPRPMEPWSEQDSASVHVSRRDTWRRDVQNSKSWRSTRSKSSTVDNNDSGHSRSWRSTRSSGTAASGSPSAHSRLSQSKSSQRSFYSQQSVMPEIAEVVEDFSQRGGPILTRGMSGRAVVHVGLDDAMDGSIERLYYTKPLEDPTPNFENENFNDEETVETRRNEPWQGRQYSGSMLSQKFFTRRCIRINAILLLGVTLIMTVVISVAATVAETQGAPSTTRSRQTSHLKIGLSPPSQVENTILTRDVDTHIADWSSTSGRNTANENSVPFLFHVPLSGAMIAFESWASCLGLITASDGGKGEVNNTTLKSSVVIGTNFVNVDVTNPEGIEHAATMGLVPSSLPDVIVSPLFGEVISKLYSSTHTASFIMIMRHPIDRAVAIYEHTKKIPNGPALQTMTLEEYALSGHIENNYMVRLLTGKSKGKLTNSDVNFCKELLRRKAVLGVYEKLGASLVHIERYLRLTPVAPDTLSCQAAVLNNALTNGEVPTLDKGSTAFALLKRQNLHDIALYDYVNNFLLPYQQEVVTQQVLYAASSGQTIKA